MGKKPFETFTHERRASRYLGVVEPPLEDLLADLPTRQIMACDGVAEAQLLELLNRVRENLRPF